MFGSRTRKLAARVAELEAAAGPARLPGPDSATASGGGPGPLAGAYWGPAVSRAAAMAVPTLAYIRSQLAGGVASMPLERYRTSTDPATGEQSTDKLPPGWTTNPDPAPTMPASIFWTWVIDDLFFLGHSTLVVLARDANGWPVQFRRVLPGQVTYDPEMLAYGWALAPIIEYMGVQIPPEDVVVIAGPDEGLCNFGALTVLAALNLESSSAQAAAEPLPNIDLHQTGGEPLSETAAAALVQSWKAARALGATAYTPSNLEARTLGWSAADQQMVEARQYMATQLARLAGVNPVLVSAAMGSSSSYVYTNQADYRAAFLDDVLDRYLQSIEGRLSANDVTPRGQFLQFDRDAFTRLPLLERVQVMVGALKSGATPAAVDQLAELLGLDIDVPDDASEPAPPPPTAIPNAPVDKPAPPAPPLPSPAPAGAQPPALWTPGA